MEKLKENGKLTTIISDSTLYFSDLLMTNIYVVNMLYISLYDHENACPK